MRTRLIYAIAFALSLLSSPVVQAANAKAPNVPQTVGPFVSYCATHFGDCGDEIATDETVMELAKSADSPVCQVPLGVSDAQAEQAILDWLKQHNEYANAKTLDGIRAAIKGVWNCVAEIPNGLTYNGAPENTAAFLSYCAVPAHAKICSGVVTTSSFRAYAASIGFKNGAQGHCSIPNSVANSSALAQVTAWLATRGDLQGSDVEVSMPLAIDAIWPCTAAAASTPAQNMFVDTPPGQQEVWQGYSTHVCPPGYAMAGAHVIDNRFTCVQVVTGSVSQIHTILDTTTRSDFGRGPMHVCPPGFYMRGLHAINDWLVCSDGAALSSPFLDAAGATQGNGMHMCPVVNGRQTAMTGINDSRNDFSCASR